MISDEKDTLATGHFTRPLHALRLVEVTRGALRGVPARRGSEKRRRRLERGGDFPHQNNFQNIARAYRQTGAASAAEAVAPKKPGFSLIDEDLLKSRIYTIRGVKVMLDADLAEIYVYASGCWPSMPADEGFLTADWRA